MSTAINKNLQRGNFMFFFQVHVLVDVYHNSDFYSMYSLYIIFGVLYSVTVFANMLEIFLSISPDNRRSPFNRIFLNFLIFSSNRVILHVLFPCSNSYPCRSRLIFAAPANSKKYDHVKLKLKLCRF